MIQRPKDDTEEIPVVQKTLRGKEVPSNLSQEPTEYLSVLADVALATSDTTQPDTQPNEPPKSPPDIVTKSVEEADHSYEEAEEEMPPLEDIDA